MAIEWTLLSDGKVTLSDILKFIPWYNNYKLR